MKHPYENFLKIGYGILSIFSFVLAGMGYLVHILANTAGYLTLHGANNISNIYGFDKAKAQEVFDLFFKYQTEHYKTYFDLTIGPFNNTAGLLAILFAVAGIVFVVMFFTNRKK